MKFKKMRFFRTLLTAPLILVPTVLFAASCGKKTSIFKDNNTNAFAKQFNEMYKTSKAPNFVDFYKTNFDKILDLSIGLLYGNLAFNTAASPFTNYTALNTQIKTYIQKNNAFYLATLYTQSQKNNFNQQITNNIVFFALMNLAMACSYNDYFDTTYANTKEVFESEGFDPTAKPTSNDPLSALFYVLGNTKTLNISSKLVASPIGTAKTIGVNLATKSFIVSMYSYAFHFLTKNRVDYNPFNLFLKNQYKHLFQLGLDGLNSNDVIGATSSVPWTYNTKFSLAGYDWQLTSNSIVDSSSDQYFQLKSFSFITKLPKNSTLIINPVVSSIAGDFYSKFNVWSSGQPSDKNTLYDYLNNQNNIEYITNDMFQQLYDLDNVISLQGFVNNQMKAQNVFQNAPAAWSQNNLVTYYIDDITNTLRKFMLFAITIISLYQNATNSTIAAINSDGTVDPASLWGSFEKYLQTTNADNGRIGHFMSAANLKTISLNMKNFFQNTDNLKSTNKIILLVLAPLTKFNLTAQAANKFLTLNPIKTSDNPPTSGAGNFNYQMTLKFGDTAALRNLFTFNLRTICNYDDTLKRICFNQVSYENL